MAVSKNKPFVFFFLAIIAVSVLMFLLEWHKRRIPSLVVVENKGIAELFTLDGRLAAVFQDGLTCAWDWQPPHVKQAEFRVGSGRAIPLRGAQLAALGRMGDRHLLSVYDLDSGRKSNDLTVGWDDQDVHVRVSPDRGVAVVIRRNREHDGRREYEFLIVDVGAEILRPAVMQSLAAGVQTLRDFAVSDEGVLYAGGADGGKARLLAVDLNIGQTLWDQSWPLAEEVTSVAVSLDGRTVWAGDRGGNLLTVAAEDGQMHSMVSLLEPGETRPVTNDFSVLNLVVSPDGRRLGCTIAPIAYAVEAESGVVTHRLGGHKVVSKVAFSPDSRKLATSDLRADGVIRPQSLE